MSSSSSSSRSIPSPSRLALACGLMVAAMLAGCNDSSGEGAVGAGGSGVSIQAAPLNRSGWVAVNAPSDALLQNLNIPADAATRGMWSAAAPWPMVGVHQAVRPDGKVLTWGTSPDGNAQNGRYFDVWDPDRGLTDPANHLFSFDANWQDSFCAPASLIADGRLMITGGNGGGGVTSQLYNSANNSFAPGASVADARWYAAMVTMADGRVMMLGGINPYTEGQYGNPDQSVAQGLSSMTPEIYENGGWRTLFGAQSRTAFGPDFLRASLPKVWLAPDGRVFGIATDQMYYVDANAAGGNGAISIVGPYKTPPQGGATNDTAPNVGPTMSGVMYAPGKVMAVGGNSYHNGSGFPASRKATSIDLNGGGAQLAELPLMAFPRNFANLIALPDGKVLATGGETRANNDPALGVFAAEQWSPVTNTWTTLASSTVFRAYHSQSALLPNGTVLVTGGGNPGPVQLKGDVFYPPYLFRSVNGAAQLAPRPRLIGISGLKHAHGAQLQFDLADSSPISQVALIGLSVGTHSFNSGQRRIPVTFTQDTFRITATVPGANLTPPGYYQVVAVDANGVPSRGTIVAVGANVNAPSVATAAYTPPDTVTGGGTPPSTVQPPTTALGCGNEGQTCNLPAGATATVWFGAGNNWVSKTGLSGAVSCDVAAFGDPIVGTVKSCVYAVTSAPPPTPTGSLPAAALGAWDFDTASGSTAADSSGNNQTLTLSNGAAFTAAGLSGQGLQSNGANSLGGGVTAGPVLDTSGSFSVSGWIRFSDLPACWNQVMASQDGNTVAGFYLGITPPCNGNPARFSFSMLGGDTDGSPQVAVTSAVTPAVGNWYHLVAVRDAQANTMTLFLDGVAVGQVSNATKWAARGGFAIGRAKFSGGPRDSAYATIDGVRAYGRVLTAAEVGVLFQARAGAGSVSTPLAIEPFSAPIIAAGATANYTVPAQAGVTYSWAFGDGSAATAFSATASASHVYANPGVYGVTVTARSSSGASISRSVLQAVRSTATAGRPVSSGATAVETRVNASARLWVVNPDNDSVSVIDTATNARVAELPVGKGPRSVAVAGDGRLWVSNKDAATLSIVNPATLAVVQTVTLPNASQPHGLAFAPGGSAYVVLEATGQLLKLDPASGATQATLALGPNVRHVSLSGDGVTALVSRFITPPLPGEATAVVNTATAGAEVLVVNVGPMTLNKTVTLRHSDKVDNEVQGSGIPNYLGAPAISPDGRSAWVPSKQDNIKRGVLRNGQGLDFQNSVRAISSRIDLPTLAEDYARRVDHDNSSLGSAAAYHPSGAYLFVALETSRQVAVVDAAGGRELLKVDVGRAPQALSVTSDGLKLYVQNFMDRSVSVLDLAPLVNQGALSLPTLGTVATVAADKLPAQVLQGKRLFYDARDPRLARDSYMSCASCHSEAGHDGRTWDFTGFGEGLRNTPALKGRAGMAQGFVHWSANFDEVQDFEGQIRAFAGGAGLMTDAQFNTGTRNTPMGDKKAGVSAELDALAAYLTSLNSFDASPARSGDGSLTVAAAAGKTVFTNANCASCHGGAGFSVSGDAGLLKNIGTVKASSGKRLNGGLAGIDVPTLRDVWKTGPYLHDGSAPTLSEAVQAHQGNTVTGTDLTNLVAYLQQIGSQESGPPSPPAPTPGNGTGLTGSYFANPNLTGTAVLTRTEAPWFDWGTGAPAAGVPADNFSVRWSGQVQALEGGSYQFRTNSDDGVRVWVNGVQIINNWTVHAPTVDTSSAVTLAAGQRVSIVVEFQEFGGGAVLQLSWLRPGGTWAAVPLVQLYPASPPVANQLPTVTLTSPATGSSVPQGSAITLNAAASDSDGTIARVDFYDGATLLGSDSTAPFSLAWNNAAVGAHSLTARATDNLGAVAVSAVSTLTVTAVAPPPPTNVTSPLYGSTTAGTAFTDPVAAGQRLTGVVVRAGWWIDSIQGLATPANLPAHGGAGGGVYTVTWPSTEYLVRVYGVVGSSGVVARISFVTNTGRVLGPYGSALGVGTLSNFDYTVPAGRRVVGFSGRSSGSLNAIGVIHGP